MLILSRTFLSNLDSAYLQDYSDQLLLQVLHTYQLGTPHFPSKHENNIYVSVPKANIIHPELINCRKYRSRDIDILVCKSHGD